jgi:hypothetical protein
MFEFEFPTGTGAIELPMSMPIVATVAVDLLDMAALLRFGSPSQHHTPEGPEHGRTILLAVISQLCFHPCLALAGRILRRLPFANVRTAIHSCRRRRCGEFRYELAKLGGR